MPCFSFKDDQSAALSSLIESRFFNHETSEEASKQFKLFVKKSIDSITEAEADYGIVNALSKGWNWTVSWFKPE